MGVGRLKAAIFDLRSSIFRFDIVKAREFAEVAEVLERGFDPRGHGAEHGFVALLFEADAVGLAQTVNSYRNFVAHSLGLRDLGT